MRALAASSAVRRDHSACSGCSLCVPVCPVWRESRDLRHSPEGRVKALQHGAQDSELAAFAQACSFCAACEPVCPENIDLLGTVRRLRASLPDTPARRALRARLQAVPRPLDAPARVDTLLVPGAGLRAHPALLRRILQQLGAQAADGLGDDISLAIESGTEIPADALQAYRYALGGARRLVVADGLLHRHLREWLPGRPMATLGETLSMAPALRALLAPGDLYLIDSRAYHADYERLVMHYHRLREERGILLNLDLQRIAVPAAARGLDHRLQQGPVPVPSEDAGHVAWLLKGRRVRRVIAECVEDMAAFARHSGLPVLHVAELAAAGAQAG